MKNKNFDKSLIFRSLSKSFCARNSLLEAHGWTLVGQRGDRKDYKRPGEGASPVGGNVQNNIFYCFTSSTVFESHKAYNCAQVYVILECNGELSEAARRLYETGYGIGINQKRFNTWDSIYIGP